MIVTLTGANTYGWQRELRQLVDAFIEQHGDLALERIDGEEAEFGRIREALTSLPFLASKKLVVLRAPSKQKTFVENFPELAADIPETNDVILVEPSLDKRLSYYKFLQSKTDFRDFKELDAGGLAQWLGGQATEREGSLNASDARYLVDRVGLDQQLLSNELDKLLLYKPEITRQAIDTLTDPTPQSTIFQLLEAAFAGNRREAMALYAEQRSMKVEPPQIIALLAWQLHVLAVIKTAGERTADAIAKEAKLSPFVVRRSQTIARKLSLTELKRLISRLLEIDVDSKRSNIAIDDALQLYLLKLASK